MTSTGNSNMQEQLNLIKDSAALLLPVTTGARRSRALRFVEPGFDRSLWAEMCELGWVGMRVPEERGGTGLGVTALCTIAQQCGAALASEPFIAAAVTAPLLQGEALEAVLAGRCIVVPAWMDRHHAFDFSGVNLDGGRGRVSGVKRNVEAGCAADAFLVAAQDRLALVDRSSAGVRVVSRGMHDGTFVGDVSFDDSPAQLLPGSFESVLEEGALASAAYLLGVMDSAFEITMDHLRTRKQFGKPIGSFQALRHRSVDLKLQIELTRAVVNEAAKTLDLQTGTPDMRRALVSRAKSRAAEAAMQVARETTHFHGAMGMTDECDIGLYARKALAVHNSWGSTLAHRKRYAASLFAQES